MMYIQEVPMALSIRNPEVEELARLLALRTGQSLTEVILQALSAAQEKLEGSPSRQQQLASLCTTMQNLPLLSPSTPDEILGYGEAGTFEL